MSGQKTAHGTEWDGYIKFGICYQTPSTNVHIAVWY